MPGVHRVGDFCSPHPCPPFSPPGAGEHSNCALGVPKVLVNGRPVAVVGSITTVHNCINPKLPPGPHVGVYIRARRVLAGTPIQAMGDLNSCAAVLVTGSPTVIVGS